MDTLLSKQELSMIEDTRFLLTKVKVMEKVKTLLGLTRKKLWDEIHQGQLYIPEGVSLQTGKISKGENYQGLPYAVLDFPAFFSKKDIFAFRTMFWWGNFFSITLHLQGRFLDQHISTISSHWKRLVSNDIYICVAPNPWEYHYESTNYRSIAEMEIDQIHRLNFLKISKRLDLKQWINVPEETSKFYTLLHDVLKKEIWISALDE